MFVGSRFCSRCGGAATRETVDDAAPLTCPRCGESLQALKLGSTVVRECRGCGGLWVDPAALQKLCDAREEHAGVTSALASRSPTSTVVPDMVRYIPCPRCKKLMNRVNFAHTSGVIMDVCKADGVWLDRGELERVVGFIDHGGLTSSRERELEQLADERRRLDAARAGSATTVTEFHAFAMNTVERRSSAASPVERLLFDALGLFTMH